MFPVDLQTGWSEVPETRGVLVKQLSGDFDEPAGKGHRTRYVRFLPGGETFAPYIHSYWEEALLAEGELTTKEDGRVLRAPCYVIRPPGTPHGPLVSATGCLLVEVQYFGARSLGRTDYLDRKAPAEARHG